MSCLRDIELAARTFLSEYFVVPRNCPKTEMQEQDKSRMESVTAIFIKSAQRNPGPGHSGQCGVLQFCKMRETKNWAQSSVWDGHRAQRSLDQR